MPTESEGEATKPPDRKAKRTRKTEREAPFADSLPEVAPQLKMQVENAIHKRQLAKDEADHKRKQEEADASFRRWKERWILIAVLVTGGAVCLTCSLVIALPYASDEIKKAAISGIFSLLTAGLGFIAGKGSKS